MTGSYSSLSSWNLWILSSKHFPTDFQLYGGEGLGKSTSKGTHITGDGMTSLFSVVKAYFGIYSLRFFIEAHSFHSLFCSIYSRIRLMWKLITNCKCECKLRCRLLSISPNWSKIETYCVFLLEFEFLPFEWYNLMTSTWRHKSWTEWGRNLQYL